MNTFPIKSWSGESEDRELQKLIPTLEKLATVVCLSCCEYHIIVLGHLSHNSEQFFFFNPKIQKFQDSANVTVSI